jgi:hypothetical protein
MALIADILLIAGALAAGLYCLVLSRRLKQFTDLERGMGGAVAVLSAQVDDMTKALERARTAAGASAETLEATTGRAEGVSQRLEILLAAMHDLPDEAPAPTEPGTRVVWRRPRAATRDADDEPATPTFRRADHVEAAE